MDEYIVDDRLSQEESTRYFDHVGLPIPRGEDGYYTQVIRKVGVPGWVFRFHGETKFVFDCLRNLNTPQAVAA